MNGAVGRSGRASGVDVDRLSLMSPLLMRLPLFLLIASVAAVVALLGWWSASGDAASHLPLLRAITPLAIGVVAVTAVLFVWSRSLVYAIDFHPGSGTIVVRRGDGSRRYALGEVRYVGLRSSEESMYSGGRYGGGGSHIERRWELHLVRFPGRAASLREPPADAPVTVRWEYMEAADWVRLRVPRKVSLGWAAAQIARTANLRCLWFGEDREPRFVAPDELERQWDVYGDPTQ